MSIRPFLFLAIPCGLLYALLIPPFQSPDEPNHFFRAWQVSEGHWLPRRTTEMRLGGYVPQGLDSLVRQFYFLKNNYAARTSLAAIEQAAGIPLQANHRVFKDFPNTALYAPTAYLPQAAAILLLRPLNAPPLLMLYLGRLANLAVWLLLVSAALRRMPFQAPLMALNAALPATLVIAASLNADVITNGLAFWLLAELSARNTGEAPLTWRRFLLVPAAAFIIAVNKIIYLPLVGAFWLGVTAAKWRSRRAWWQFSLLVVGGLAVAGWWSGWAAAQFVPYAQYPERDTYLTLNEGVDPAAQMRVMADAPGRFLLITLRSAVEAAPSTAAHLVGKFGWEKNYLPAPLIGLLWLGLPAAAFLLPNPLRRRARLWALTLVGAMVVAFAITMYVLWCPVGAPEVTNWQGRYFLPMLPLVWLCFGRCRNRELTTFEKLSTLYAALWWAAQVAMLYAIWQRYYTG